MSNQDPKLIYEYMLLDDALGALPICSKAMLGEHHTLLQQDVEYKALFNRFSSAVKPIYENIPVDAGTAGLTLEITSTFLKNMLLNLPARKTALETAEKLYKIYSASPNL